MCLESALMKDIHCNPKSMCRFGEHGMHIYDLEEGENCLICLQFCFSTLHYLLRHPGPALVVGK